jgi:hypothetical protein
MVLLLMKDAALVMLKMFRHASNSDCAGRCERMSLENALLHAEPE